MMYVFLFSLRYDLGKTAGVLFILAGDAYDIVRNGDLENVIRRFFFSYKGHCTAFGIAIFAHITGLFRSCVYQKRPPT